RRSSTASGRRSPTTSPTRNRGQSPKGKRRPRGAVFLAMNRLKQIFAVLAVNLLLLAAGIVAVELIFGGWLDPRRLNRLNILKDRVYRHDVSSLYPAADPVVTYTRDKYG